MKSIIEEILNGQRGHAETIKMSKNYWDVTGKIADFYDGFLKNLPQEKKSELEKLCDLFDEKECESSTSHFIEGVKLGILLGVEACN